MTLKEAYIRIGELNSEVKMLRTLKNDLLYYNRVCFCKECIYKKKGWCEMWSNETPDDGYCHEGRRRNVL